MLTFPGMLGLLLSFLLLPAGGQLIKPGFNFFSPGQDTAIGAESSSLVESRSPIIHDAATNEYLTSVGIRLSRHPQMPRIRYRFRLVNAESADSVAYPGGFIYVNRGMVQVTESEAEMAAILAHQIAHVAARHGTAQISRQLLVQAPLSIAEGLLTDGAWRQQLTRLGISLGPGGAYLHHRREDEMDANRIALQLLVAQRYDPAALSTVVERLMNAEREQPASFLSDHPQPEAWPAAIDEEISRLTLPRRPKRDTADFQNFRSAVRRLPRPRPVPEDVQSPEAESTLKPYSHPLGYYSLGHPADWQASAAGPNGAIIAPAGGVQSTRTGDNVTRGILVDLFDISDRNLTLEQATERLLVFLRQRNQSLRFVPGAQTNVLLDGQPARRTVLLGQSAATPQRELVWVVTRVYYRSLFYLVLVAPDEEFAEFQPIFEEIVSSVRLR